MPKQVMHYVSVGITIEDDDYVDSKTPLSFTESTQINDLTADLLSKYIHDAEADSPIKLFKDNRRTKRCQ